MKPLPKPLKPGARVKQRPEARKTKTFKTAAYTPAQKGKRIVVYADSGMGKTTLESLLPNPWFVNFRGGSDQMKHPVTGEPLNYIPGVETFDDVRDVCRQTDLFKPGDSFVLDTATEFESGPILSWMLANVKHEKIPDKVIKYIGDYGYGNGFRYLYDTARLPLASYDFLIDRGVNVVLSCQMQQVELKNSGGEDYQCDVPKLQKEHGKSTPSVWALYNEWADHILKIDYEAVLADKGKAAGTSERVIRVHGEPHFKAKSRSVPHLFPVVSFSEPSDDSIWRFLFDEAWRETDEWKEYQKEITGDTDNE